MSKLLITGGAGFIGSSLASKLFTDGHRVSILDNLSKQIHGDNPKVTSPLFKSLSGRFEFFEGSITDRKLVETAIKDADVIVHLAAETGTGQSMYNIYQYVDVNIGGTALLLDVLANTKHTVKKLIVASSRSIYGEGKYLDETSGMIVYPNHRVSLDMDKGDFEVKWGHAKLKVLPTDEESKIHPSSVYGITKQNQEQMVMTVCPTIGIAPVAFRYQNVYGPGQSLKNPYTGILSIFSTLIKTRKPINVFEDGKESRDFVFIDDVVEATCLGIESSKANGEVFNVGTGVQTDVLTVAKTLINAYRQSVPVEISGNYRLGDIRHNFADITKIRSLLGFAPKVDFDSGIRRFSEWVNQQEITETNFDRSLAEMKEKGLFK